MQISGGAMKTALLSTVLGVFLFSAQGGVQPSDRRIQATADAVMQDGNIFHLRGHVEIRRGSVVVTADEADLPARVDLKSSQPTVTLRGDVHMTVEDAVPLSVTQR
jgi:lipopolysaccharide export system protein LptA